jgi:hypothetical protein
VARALEHRHPIALAANAVLLAGALAALETLAKSRGEIIVLERQNGAGWTARAGSNVGTGGTLLEAVTKLLRAQV